MSPDIIPSHLLKELLSQWQTHRGLRHPPAQPIRLWAEGGRWVGIDKSWGPTVPYGPVDHGDGQENHGYIRIKGDAEAIRRVPEAVDWPELGEFLTAVNAAASPIESVGCEKGFFPVEGVGVPTVKLGSYIDVIFTDAALNDLPENGLLLASHLLPAIDGCERWWSDTEIALQRLRGVVGAVAPWGLMLRVTGYGRNEQEARKFWGVTLGRLTQAVAKLPKDLRWQDAASVLT